MQDLRAMKSRCVKTKSLEILERFQIQVFESCRIIRLGK